MNRIDRIRMAECGDCTTYSSAGPSCGAGLRATARRIE